MILLVWKKWKNNENIFKNFAENISLDDISKIDGAFTFGSDDIDDDDPDNAEKPHIAGAAIPLGSIFSSMFGENDTNSQSQEDSSIPGNSKKKVKIEKKKNQKQRKQSRSQLKGDSIGCHSFHYGSYYLFFS